jgi:hypothetical protein
MIVDSSKIVYKECSFRNIDGCRTAACSCGTAIGFPNELIVRTDIYNTICPICGEIIGLYCVSDKDYENGFRCGSHHFVN